MYFNKILVFLAFFSINLAQAETAIEDESGLPAAPINIAADSVEHDEKTRTITYTGNVEITQETSLQINADQLLISEENEGEYNIEASGSPATFTHTPPDGKTISGHANKANYEAGRKVLVLTGNASVTQRGSTISSDRIVIDLEKSVATAGGPSSGGQRVHTVIQPGNNDQ